MPWIDGSGWTWGWGWGWAAAVAAIIVLGIFLLPWFFFLLNLQTTLNRVSIGNRAMPAGQVWLNFIPVFNLGWFIYTVFKVRDSVKAEYASRGWPAEGDFASNVGLATGILAIVSFFIGWVPVLGWGAAVAQVVCWIVYWLKTAEFKNRLAGEGIWRSAVPPYGYQGPYQGSGAPPAGPGPSAGVGPGGGDAAAGAGPSAGAPASRQCAGCGAEFDPSDRFCRTCGLPLPGGRG